MIFQARTSYLGDEIRNLMGPSIWNHGALQERSQ